MVTRALLAALLVLALATPADARRRHHSHHHGYRVKRSLVVVPVITHRNRNPRSCLYFPDRQIPMVICSDGRYWPVF